MAFMLSLLPPEVVTIILEHLYVNDILNLNKIMPLNITKKVYDHAFHDDTYFAKYDLEMFLDRANAKVYVNGYRPGLSTNVELVTRREIPRTYKPTKAVVPGPVVQVSIVGFNVSILNSAGEIYSTHQNSVDFRRIYGRIDRPDGYDKNRTRRMDEGSDYIEDEDEEDTTLGDDEVSDYDGGDESIETADTDDSDDREYSEYSDDSDESDESENANANDEANADYWDGDEVDSEEFDRGEFDRDHHDTEDFDDKEASTEYEDEDDGEDIEDVWFKEEIAEYSEKCFTSPYSPTYFTWIGSAQELCALDSDGLLWHLSLRDDEDIDDYHDGDIEEEIFFPIPQVVVDKCGVLSGSIDKVTLNSDWLYFDVEGVGALFHSKLSAFPSYCEDPNGWRSGYRCVDDRFSLLNLKSEVSLRNAKDVVVLNWYKMIILNRDGTVSGIRQNRSHTQNTTLARLNQFGPYTRMSGGRQRLGLLTMKGDIVEAEIGFNDNNADVRVLNGLPKMASIACAESYSLALSQDGDVYSWGNGAHVLRVSWTWEI